MAKTRSVARNQNYDACSSMKRSKTCDKGVVAPWSGLNHDVLYLVMMKLGVFDFVAFSGVCKSWRSLAVPNRKMFMESRPPMNISISTESNEKECSLELEDFEGRKFKTILPHLAGRTCVGLTCGYLVLFGSKTHDFWLVNLITRHELHFTQVPLNVFHAHTILRAILVFSPSICGWVLAILNIFDNRIWFSIAGEGTWDHVSSTSTVVDLHAFKGKIYTTDIDWRLCEMRLDPQPRLTFLETNKCPEPNSCWVFSCYGGYLNLWRNFSQSSCTVYPIGFSEMKLMLHKHTDEYTCLLTSLMHGAAVKPDSWDDPRSQYWRYFGIDKTEIARLLLTAKMWYFPMIV